MSTENPFWLSLVREKVETLRFGVVQIVVHDSRVTQIERTERTRLECAENTKSGGPSKKLNRPDMLEVP